jgi:hypothetical protein
VTHASHIPKVMLPGSALLTETVPFPHTLHSVVIFAPSGSLALFAQPQRAIYLSRITLTRHVASEKHGRSGLEGKINAGNRVSG